MMDAKTRTTEFADKTAAQAKDAYAKTTAAAGEATEFIRNTCSLATQGAQDYNAKVIEFARTNTLAAFDFASRLSSVKSPSEFMQLSTEHARQQFEVLTGQAKELAALAQKVTLQSAEPLKAGFSKAYSQAV